MRSTTSSPAATAARTSLRQTEATDSELAEELGVSRLDSVPNLTRRFVKWLADREAMRKRL
ncbi:MAG TPA: hypothetical protein VHS97_01540 [Isosphaeraceae bacterium]|nr:hypothetical protein [Isosphaeraceae bacterium]